jgi:hypothetical protein
MTRSRIVPKNEAVNMRTRTHLPTVGILSTLAFLLGPSLSAAPEKPVWPLTLREGLPTALAGYEAAPRDPLPQEEENEMGKYTEVSRFFQRIESPTSAKQFRLAIQDYGAGRDVQEPIRKAFLEASRAGVEARETLIGGAKAYVVTDRSGLHPTTLVTVLVTPSRLVLGQGANVSGDEAVKLVGRVDVARVASAK